MRMLMVMLSNSLLVQQATELAPVSLYEMLMKGGSFAVLAAMNVILYKMLADERDHNRKLTAQMLEFAIENTKVMSNLKDLILQGQSHPRSRKE